MRILVTGGTGHLGRPIVSALQRQGHQVRVLARRPSSRTDVEHVKGDLATGEGVRRAVMGVDEIIHAATNSPMAQRGRFTFADLLRSPSDVDVGGTKALLAAAEEAGVAHFTHVSIVALERQTRMVYARRKLEAEAEVMRSGVPWSIVRATPFYWLAERMCESMAKQRILALPAQLTMEPVDSDEFAGYIVEGVADGRRGEWSDFVGPQTLTMVELMEQYLSLRGPERRIRRAPLPRKVQDALSVGSTSPFARRGTTTWAQWLRGAHGGDLRPAA